MFNIFIDFSQSQRIINFLHGETLVSLKQFKFLLRIARDTNCNVELTMYKIILSAETIRATDDKLNKKCGLRERG